MTRGQLQERFPTASEAFLKANAKVLRVEVVPGAPKARSVAKKALPEPSKKKGQRVARTRNGGTWSEAKFWGCLRSALRRTYRFWKPAVMALKAARIPMSGPRGRKWGFICAGCGKAYLRKQVNIDHKEPAGALTDYAHIGPFLKRLTPEDPAAYQVLCTGAGTCRCHEAKTAKDKAERALAA